jgi:hypothetical protein
MNRFTDINWKTIAIAPLVIAGVGAAVWLSIVAARENFRFARATGQILNVIAVARDMRVPPATSPRQATTDLYERLTHFDNTRVRPAAEGKKAALDNPWGGSVELEMLPALHQLRLQATVSPVVCRKMVQFYAKDAGPLGLQRVEAHEEGFADMPGRLLYDAQDATLSAQPDGGLIAGGCGAGGQTILKLTFGLLDGKSG